MAEPTDVTPLRGWRRRKPSTREVVRSETRVEIPEHVLKRLADLEQRVGNLELATGESLPANDQSIPGIEALHREVNRMRKVQTDRNSDLQALVDRIEALEGLAAALNERGDNPLAVIAETMHLMNERQKRQQAEIDRAIEANRTLSEIAARTQASLKQLEAG